MSHGTQHAFSASVRARLVWFFIPVLAPAAVVQLRCGGKVECEACDAGLGADAPPIETDDGGVAHVPPGSVCADEGFGDAGTLVLLDPHPGPSAMLAQPDGKFLVTNGEVLARYDSTGALDTTFGSGGMTTWETGYVSNPAPVAMAFAGDAIAIECQRIDQQTVTGHSIVREFDSSGAPLVTFGTQGVAEDVPLAQFAFSDVKTLADGSVIVAGTAMGGVSGDDFLVAKYTASGLLDGSFGQGGVVRHDLAGGSDDAGYRLVVQSDGKIVVAGTSNFVPDAGVIGTQVTLVRYAANGALDATYGTNGIAKLFPILPPTYDHIADGYSIFALALGPSDAVVVAVGDLPVPPVVARVDASGALDATFGSGGFIHPPTVSAISVEPSGAVLVGMPLLVDGGTGSRLVASRYDSTGALDVSYGTSGYAYATFPNENQVRPSAQVITPGGALLVGGDGLPTYIDGGFSVEYARFACP